MIIRWQKWPPPVSEMPLKNWFHSIIKRFIKLLFNGVAISQMHKILLRMSALNWQRQQTAVTQKHIYDSETDIA